jgi:hypothetical protein
VNRSRALRTLSADDVEMLARWYRDSYDAGWRPVMQSHVAGVEGCYTPPRAPQLRERVGLVLDHVDEQQQLRDLFD